MLRSETNTQILSNLHFSDPTPENFDSPSQIKFPLRLYYSRAGFLSCRATSLHGSDSLGAVPPSPVLPHPYSENSCDSFFRPVDLHGNRPLHAASAKRPEVGLRHLDRSVLDETKRILETKTRRNPTRKSVPPRARKRTKSGRVREGQNSRIRRPSKSVHFSIEVLFKI